MRRGLAAVLAHMPLRLRGTLVLVSGVHAADGRRVPTGPMPGVWE